MLTTSIVLATILNPLTTYQGTQVGVKTDALKVGDLAPDFTANKWNGGYFKLSNRNDKVAIVTFWNSSSPDSKLVLNHLREIHGNVPADQLVTFLYINTGDDNGTYSEWMNKNAGRYPGTWGYDPNGSTSDSIASKWYSTNSLPTTFVIGRTGRVFAIINGYQTGDSRYKEAIKNAGIKIM